MYSVDLKLFQPRTFTARFDYFYRAGVEAIGYPGSPIKDNWDAIVWAMRQI